MECPAPMLDQDCGDCGIAAVLCYGRNVIRPYVQLWVPGVGAPGSDAEIVTTWRPVDLEPLFPMLTSGGTRNFDVAGV